jgi:hypothetical protein
MDGNGIVIDPTFSARLYPWRPLSMAVQNSCGRFQCVTAFQAFAHDSSLLMHASIDRHVRMCIQSYYGVLQLQHGFFPL